MAELHGNMENNVPLQGCYWNSDEAGKWGTQCGNTFLSLNGSGPAENHFRYCPYCGKKLIDREVIAQRILAEGVQFQVQENIENRRHPADGIDE